MSDRIDRLVDRLLEDGAHDGITILPLEDANDDELLEFLSRYEHQGWTACWVFGDDGTGDILVFGATDLDSAFPGIWRWLHDDFYGVQIFHPVNNAELYTGRSLNAAKVKRWIKEHGSVESFESLRERLFGG